MKDFKTEASKRSLRKRLRNFRRIRESHNFDTAQTAGILFTPTDQTSFEQIKQFLSYLSQYKLQIYVLGYYDDKEIPESFLFWKGINLFCKKDLKWSKVPKTPVVNDFIEKEFDILLDLSLGDYYPLEYVARLSKSKFKVGRFTERHNGYDLMIDIKQDHTLDDYLDHIKLYMNLINKKLTE